MVWLLLFAFNVVKEYQEHLFMKISRRSAFLLVCICIGIPVSIVPALLVFFGFQGHERLLERGIESLTGFSADIRSVKAVTVNTFMVEKIVMGDRLCIIHDVQAECAFNPFVITSIRVNRVECDLTGSGYNSFKQMVRHISEHADRENYGTFSAYAGRLDLTVDRPGYRAEEVPVDISFHQVGVTSDAGGNWYGSIDSASADEKAHTFRLSSVHRPAELSGSVAVTADAGIADFFSGKSLSISSARIEGCCTYSWNGDNTSANSVTCIFNAVDSTHDNRITGKVEVDAASGIIDIKGFRTDLGKIMDLVSFPSDTYVSIGGKNIVGAGTVRKKTDGSGCAYSLVCKAEKPELVFKKDIVLNRSILHLSNLKTFNPDSLHIDCKGAFSRVSADACALTIDHFRGLLGSEQTFWNVKGSLTMTSGTVSSDITAGIYEVPVTCAETLFLLYDTDYSWIEKWSGPIDISISGFDLRVPHKTPLVLSSGSRGGSFWIEDRLPRIDGIYFTNLKMYLPQPEEKK